MSLLRNSTPIVWKLFSSNWFDMNRDMRQLFPTPPSPMHSRNWNYSQKLKKENPINSFIPFLRRSYLHWQRVTEIEINCAVKINYLKSLLWVEYFCFSVSLATSLQLANILSYWTKPCLILLRRISADVIWIQSGKYEAHTHTQREATMKKECENKYQISIQSKMRMR